MTDLPSFPTSRDPLRHDPPRRHAGREHHALPRRQAARRADARRVRHARSSRAAGRARTPRTSSSSRGRRQRWQTARLAAFGSTRHRANRPEDDPNLHELVAAETPVVTIFGKTWLLHVTEVLGATPAGEPRHDRGLGRRSSSIAVARWSTTPSTSSMATAPTAGYALSTLRAAREAGARTLVLCDTNGGTLTGELVLDRGRRPRRRSRATRTRRPSIWGIHTHNDAELAVANSIAAVQAGVRHVQATINGYGERCGNANMVSILANLALKTAHRARARRRRRRSPALTELSRSVAEIANVAPNDYQPYVGRSAFAHKGGVHGAAVAKVERSYQHVDPTAVGNAGRLVVSELGGRANTAIRARQLGHELEGVVDPRELSQAHQAARERGSRVRGRGGLVRAAHPPPGGRLRGRRSGSSTTPCLVEQRSGRELLAEATVKVEVAGEVLHTAADGNGPVNALDGAVRKALRAFYPVLDEGPPRGLQGAHPRRRLRDRRPDPGHHRFAGRRDDVVDDGQRHEHHRGLGAALADSLEYAIWRSGAELRRRDERHFTTSDGPARPARRPDGAAASPATASTGRPRAHAPSAPRRDHPAGPLDRHLRVQRPEPRRGHPRRGGPRSGRRRPRGTARSTRCTGDRPGAARPPRRPSAAARRTTSTPSARARTRSARSTSGSRRRPTRASAARASTPARLAARTSSRPRSRPTSRPQRDARRGALVGRGGGGDRRGGACAVDGGARARRAELDEDAGDIDTTEWFNR